VTAKIRLLLSINAIYTKIIYKPAMACQEVVAKLKQFEIL
jgi:hypothetical protein